jgi:hypothetical protein
LFSQPDSVFPAKPKTKNQKPKVKTYLVDCFAMPKASERCPPEPESEAHFGGGRLKVVHEWMHKREGEQVSGIA